MTWWPLQRTLLESGCTSAADYYFQVSCSASSTISETIVKYGEETVAEYLKHAIPITQRPYQDRQDLLHTIRRYAGALLSESAVDHACADIEAYPVVLTGNHHGATISPNPSRQACCARFAGGRMVTSHTRCPYSPARTYP